MPAAAFTEWMRDPARHAPHLEASSYPQAGLPAGEAGPRELPSGPVGRAACAVQRAVQPVGGAALAVAVTLMAAYGLWQVFRWGGRGHQQLIGDLWFVPVIGATTVLAWRASRRADLGRNACRAWRLLAVALLLYLAGDLLQLAYEAVLHRAYPTWAYLAFYPVAFCGLISFRDRRRSGPEWLRLLLEMGMEVTGAWMVIWYVALGPAIVAANGHFGLFNLGSYAYPVGDLLLLFGTLTVLVRGAPQSSVLALRIFAIGMVAYIAADVIYDHIIVYSAYHGGDPVDTLWILAQIIICLAAVCQLRTKPAGVLDPLPKPAPQRPSLLPYLAIVGSYLLLAVIGLRSVRFDSLGEGLLAGAVALTFLVSARQYIALHDYGRLAVRYQELAAVDGITGLYNRRHFMEAAEAAVARAQRPGRPLVALMIDVDHFKQINDTYGHVAGDQVLAEMARACREHVRSDDIVGRYGGDEFIIIIVGITSLRATQIAEPLARPAACVLSRDGKPLTYSASVGIAECQPGWDLPTLLTHADQAMYEAKRAGGGSWRIYDDTMGATQAATRRAAAPAPQAADRHSAPARPWLVRIGRLKGQGLLPCGFCLGRAA
jgi:diguanylate cyclase (GGDEF)-like protein